MTSTHFYVVLITTKLPNALDTFISYTRTERERKRDSFSEAKQEYFCQRFGF